MFVSQTLYNVKVRRMVVMGLPPIGCAPYYLWKYRSQNGECAEEVNSMIMESNFVMRYTVDKLNHELQGASIIYCDVFQSAMDILRNHQLYGKHQFRLNSQFTKGLLLVQHSIIAFSWNSDRDF